LALIVVTATDPSPVPLAGITVSHVASSITLQIVFEVTAILPVVPDPDPTVRLVDKTVKVGVAPDWVTVTSTELTPEAEKVTVALLGVIEVLALLVVTVTDPFPVPLAGAIVSHAASSFTRQLVFEVTAILPFVPDPDPTVWLVGNIDKVGVAPDCVTVTFIELTPDAEKVTVALLELAEVFALLVVTVTDLFPVPFSGVTVSHVALSITLQLVFEVTAILPVVPDPDPTVRLVGNTDKVGAAPDCVTVTFIELTPDAEKVTVALLELAEVFALLVVTVTDPFPVPLAGAIVSHAASSFTLQLVFEVIAILPFVPDPDPTVWLVGNTDKVGVAPDCVTVTFIELTPDAEKVTVALLELVEVFALLAVTVTDLFPVPFAGVTVSHVALSITLQLVFEVTAMLLVVPDPDPTVRFVGKTVKVGVAPDWVTVTSTELTPDAEKLTVALLELAEVFALLVVIVTDLFPIPFAGATVNHVALSITLQLVFEVTAILPVVPDPDPTLRLVGKTVKVGELEKATLKDIVVPSTPTSEIFNPPRSPFWRKLLGFVASFKTVLLTEDEK